MPKQFSWPHPSDAMNAVAQLSAPGATDARSPAIRANRPLGGPALAYGKTVIAGKTGREPDAATPHPPVGRVDIPRPGSREDAYLPLHHAKSAPAAK